MGEAANMETQSPRDWNLHPDEQIDFGSILSELWLKKTWIAGVTAFCAAVGLAYALVTPSVYYSEAIVAPKGSPGSDARQGMLSQFGGLGIVAAQLGMGNNNLDHLEVMLKSRGLAEKVILDNDLLPLLFPKEWDSDNRDWKPKGSRPGLRDGIEAITDGMLRVKSDTKKQIILVGMESLDSVLSARLINLYLAAFNQKIQSSVRIDADSNRSYLESQLEMTADPLLREKIQNLIAGQMEKAMLVSSSSFDILERPYVPQYASRPRRTMIVLFSFFSGLIASSFFLVFLSVVRGSMGSVEAVADRKTERLSGGR